MNNAPHADRKHVKRRALWIFYVILSLCVCICMWCVCKRVNAFVGASVMDFQDLFPGFVTCQSRTLAKYLLQYATSTASNDLFDGQVRRDYHS